MRLQQGLISTVLGCALGLMAVMVSAEQHAPANEELQMKSHGDIDYISGGVGDDEQQRMDELAGNFSLQLTFADREGKYLSGVEIKVRDGNGDKVLKTRADGPMFYADLAPGDYTVYADPADFSGEKQTREVSISESPVRVNLVW